MRALGLASSLVVLGASALLAQDSVFGIRGLGVPGRPVSARSSSAGGGFAMFDQEGGLNPAALAAWRGVAGWAVGAPSRRTFAGASGDATLTSTRFPLFGFATVLGPRLVLGVTISDYLDRNWSVSQTTLDTLRGAEVEIEDLARSSGGISDIRFAASWRAMDRLAVGLGFHALSGSTRMEARRTFDDGLYSDFFDLSLTDFSGLAASAGAVASLRANLTVAGSVRLGHELKAVSDSAGSARVPLPLEAGVGLMFGPAPGVLIAGGISWTGWSRASAQLLARGGGTARSTIGFGAGVEFESFRRGTTRVPLRAGYRWRGLPFPVGGEDVSEQALTGGFGLNLTGGRTTLDIGLERGSRAAGPDRETFLTGFIGLTVRP